MLVNLHGAGPLVHLGRGAADLEIHSYCHILARLGGEELENLSGQEKGHLPHH